MACWISRLFPQRLRLKWKVSLSREHFKLPTQRRHETLALPFSIPFTTPHSSVSHRAGHYYISICYTIKTFSMQWLLFEQYPAVRNHQILLTEVERPTGPGNPSETGRTVSIGMSQWVRTGWGKENLLVETPGYHEAYAEILPGESVPGKHSPITYHVLGTQDTDRDT